MVLTMFKETNPAVAAALDLLAGASQDAVKALQPGESLLQKLAAFEGLVPELVVLLPQVGSIGTEIKSFGPADYAAAAEYLVTDLAFSAPKAQAVIRAAFPVLDALAALEPLMVAFVKQIEA